MSERTYVNPRTGEVVETEPRSFDQILRELGEGQTLAELSEAFYDVVQRVMETSKAGSVTLTIAVGFDGAGRLAVKDTVKHKLPEFNRPETRFYVDRSGNASRRDPNQPALPSLDERRNAKEGTSNT